jgi:hypothetical protein
MDDYLDTLTSRVKSAEAFILGEDLRTRSAASRDASGDPRTLDDPDIPSNRDARSTNRSMLVVHSSAYLTLNQLEKTIEDGRTAFNNLILMSTITFGAGLVLLFFAAIAGMLLQRDFLTLVFGLLGVAVILALFVMKPKEKIQTALANMIQAQVIYLDFCNQLQIWAPSAQHANSAEERKQASEALYDVTTFTLKALHDYVKPQKALSTPQ